MIIYCEEDQPEVRGVLAWTQGQGVAILDPEEEIEIPRRRVAFLSQATKSEESFAGFVARFLARNIGAINELRRELAAEGDLLIVIGGRNSANTRKLAQTCVSTGVETHHIETAAELDAGWLEGKECVGVTAGASTPDESIDEVAARLKQLDGKLRGTRPAGGGRRRLEPSRAST